MATIKEDYCSQEVYRLLREKGFDGEIHTTFDKDGYTQASITTQMAMKWLREVHKLFIQIRIIPHTTITIEQKYYLFTIHKDRRMLAFRKDFPSEYYFTYEEACEAAIKYCLENLI